VCADHLTKRARIDAAARVLKLRMVECIEGFKAQLRLLRFREADVFEQR
jgi:hypothetical protein